MASPSRWISLSYTRATANRSVFNVTYKGEEGLLSHRTNTLDNGHGPCGCWQTTATMWLWWLDPGTPIYTAVRERYNT